LTSISNLFYQLLLHQDHFGGGKFSMSSSRCDATGSGSGSG